MRPCVKLHATSTTSASPPNSTLSTITTCETSPKSLTTRTIHIGPFPPRNAEVMRTKLFPSQYHEENRKHPWLPFLEFCWLEDSPRVEWYNGVAGFYISTHFHLLGTPFFSFPLHPSDLGLLCSFLARPVLASIFHLFSTKKTLFKQS